MRHAQRIWNTKVYKAAEQLSGLNVLAASLLARQDVHDGINTEGVYEP